MNKHSSIYIELKEANLLRTGGLSACFASAKSCLWSWSSSSVKSTKSCGTNDGDGIVGFEVILLFPTTLFTDVEVFVDKLGIISCNDGPVVRIGVV